MALHCSPHTMRSTIKFTKKKKKKLKSVFSFFLGNRFLMPSQLWLLYLGWKNHNSIRHSNMQLLFSLNTYGSQSSLSWTMSFAFRGAWCHPSAPSCAPACQSPERNAQRNVNSTVWKWRLLARQMYNANPTQESEHLHPVPSMCLI